MWRGEKTHKRINWSHQLLGFLALVVVIVVLFALGFYR
jgi:hypothetical protein